MGKIHSLRVGGMSRFLYYEQCPRCLENGKDSRGDNLAVYQDGGKHCFSCHYHVFPKHYVQPKEREQVNAAVLPTDFSRQVPSHALKWLLQYELPFSYWSPFIGWSEKDMRLVFTVGEGPDFSIGRYLPEEGRSFQHGTKDDKQPRKWFVWGNSHRKAHVLGDYSKASKIVLVEDIISAHKVGQATGCICLFGTGIPSSFIPVLRHIALPIRMWLDKDQEDTMPKKCNWLSSVTNQHVSYVVTSCDPKECSFTKINEVLK